MSAIGLVELNVWLDAAFLTLFVIVLLGLAAHFVGNIITGRAKRRFLEWQWPESEGPPVPTLQKFLHFQHVASMIVLAVTGLYIRFPLSDRGLTAMRYIHYAAMIIVTVNLVWRLWYAFASRTRDFREFAITWRDIVTAPQVILYYIFAKKSKPHLGKYNVMQKGTYLLFVPLLVLQAFTGFALLTFNIPYIHVSPRDILLGWWLGVLLGSTDLAGWWARTAHYVINWLFIILTTIHVYLSVVEDFPALLDFFGLGFLDRERAHGGEGHGHGQETGASEPAPVLSHAD